MSNGMNTASESLLQESEMESCPSPPSSLTCVSSYSPVQPQSTEALRTWLQQDSPANLSQLPGSDKAQTTSGICGPPQETALALFSPDTSTWKTRQMSLLHMEAQFLVSWPRWGMTADGMLWELWRYPAEQLRAKELGLPGYIRPTARDWKGPSGKNFREKYGNHNLADCLGGIPNPEFSEWLMGWPIGWTGLEPLETGKFRQWQQQHGDFLRSQEIGDELRNQQLRRRL